MMRPMMRSSGRGPKLRLSMGRGCSSSLSASTHTWPAADVCSDVELPDMLTSNDAAA